MRCGVFVLVSLALLSVAGSARSTVCMGPFPQLVAAPIPLVATVASVGNGVSIARGERAGSGWVWTGYLSGGLSIAAGYITHGTTTDGVCNDDTAVLLSRMYVGVGIVSVALSLVSHWIPEPPPEEDPGPSVGIAPWVAPMENGRAAVGAGLVVVGF